jgi:SAM-dependent methyltransferase
MDWENAYQQKETPWDKGEPSPGLVDLLALTPMAGRVLVPGCGLGHDVRAISALPGTEVIGVDVAPTAVELARGFTVVGRERYALVDLFGLPASYRGAFDWVWEHTCFCAIPKGRREEYVAAVRASLLEGGRLAAIFYLDPGWDDPEQGPPFGVSKAELDGFFLGAGRFALEQEWVPARAYAGREGRELIRVMRAV